MNEPKRMQSSLEYIFIKILEPATLIYLTACIVCYSLYTIPAFPRLMNTINMNSILRPLLRNIGVILCILEGICSLRMHKGPGRLLLYGMIATAAFSSWQQRAYGFTANINSLLWMSIIFILGYSAVYHYGSRVLRLYSALAYAVFLTVWCTACCLSLVQFALRISNIGPNYTDSPWLQGTGFVPPRLTGIFGYPEYGASFGLLLIIVGLYWIVKVRWWILRIIIALFNLPLFFYLVLSITRNAILAMYLAVFVGAFLLFLKNVRQTARNGILVSLGLACAAIFVLFCVQMGTKRIAEPIPEFFDKATPTTESPATFVPSPSPGSSVPVHALHSRIISDRIPLAVNLAYIHHPEASAARIPTPEKSPAQTDKSPGLLDRSYGTSDLTSGRIQIWKDYLSISKEIGLVGLSPENASWYIQEHHPDLQICTYIKVTNPSLYEKGYVFHPHSGYLKVFVSAGFVGLACVLVFFLRCAITVISYIRRSRHLSAEFICSLMVVVAGLSTALFENELFFNLTNPIMFFFWIAVSILMRSMSHPEKARSEKRRSQQGARQ